MSIFKFTAKINFWLCIVFGVLFCFIKIVPQLILLGTVLWSTIYTAKPISDSHGLQSLVTGLVGALFFTYSALFFGWRAGYISFSRGE